MTSEDPKKKSVSVIRYPDENKNQENYEKDDLETVELVEQVKAKLKKQLDKKVPIEESDVEFATFDARCEETKYCNNMEKWKKSIIRDRKETDLFDVSAAYGKTTDEIQRIFKEKQQQFSEDPASYPKRKYVESSLNNIIPPLKESNKRKPCENLQDLFQEIRCVQKVNVLRADRMFFAEVTRLVPKNLENYTIENAHDQVQAICLMHYKPESGDSLSGFVRKCQTFESAYAYLQNLVNEQSKKKSESSSRAQETAGSGSQNYQQSSTSSGSQNYQQSNTSSGSQNYQQSSTSSGSQTYQQSSTSPDSSSPSTASNKPNLVNNYGKNSAQNRQSFVPGQNPARSAVTQQPAGGNNNKTYRS